MGVEKNKLLIAGLCVVIVALVIVCVVVAMGNGNNSAQEKTEIDVTGQWQAVNIEIMYMDGTVDTLSLKDEEIAIHDIYVYNNFDGVINGFTNGYLFAGAYSDGVILSDIIAGEEVIRAMAYITDANTMQIVVVSSNPDGKDNYMLAGMYTKDRSDKELMNALDIKGLWNCNFAKYADPDSVNAIDEKGTLRISNENKSGFAGTLQQIIDEGMKDTGIVGGFTRYSESGYTVGIAVDDEGYFWSIYCKGDSLVLNCCTTTDAMSGTEEIVSSLRIYEKEKGEPEINTPIDLKGTSWNGYYCKTVDQGGNYGDKGMLYTINFIEQDDNIVTGTITTGSETYAMVGTIYGSNPIALNVITEDPQFYIGKIIIQDEDEFRYMTNGYTSVSESSVIYFEKVDPNTTYDILGHWYNVYFYGFDEYGNYITISDYPSMMHLYEITVYGVSGNTFYGYYKQNYISGTFENNAVSFRCESTEAYNEAYVQFDGTLLSSNYMVATLKYFVYEDGPTHGNNSVWSGFFSTIPLDDAEIPTYDTDILGEWSYISRKSFVDEDYSYQLSGEKITIDRFEGNAFIGRMEQANSNNEVVERAIKGTIENYLVDDEGNTTAYGTFVDEIGVFWTIVIQNNEYLITHATLVSEVAQPDILLVSTERIFTRNGTGEIPDMGDMKEYKGEWKMTSSYVMEPNGKHYDRDITYTLNITDTERVLFTGSSNYSGTKGQIAGYLVEGKIYIGSLYELDGEPDSGFGWVEDGVLTLIEFYKESGEWITTISTFER